MSCTCGHPERRHDERAVLYRIGNVAVEDVTTRCLECPDDRPCRQYDPERDDMTTTTLPDALGGKR